VPGRAGTFLAKTWTSLSQPSRPLVAGLQQYGIATPVIEHGEVDQTVIVKICRREVIG